MNDVLNLKKIHTILGLILIVPITGWVITGMIFLFKPGYGEAYEQISPKFYTIDQYGLTIPDTGWSEVRIVRTILGKHLLVKNDHQWQHLNLIDFKPLPIPSIEDQIRLLTDAVSGSRERYGVVESKKGDVFVTSTGVELSFQWDTLRIYQSGNDTKLIDVFYKIHYLQWLGNKTANILLAVLALLMLLFLIGCGVAMFLRRRRYSH